MVKSKNIKIGKNRGKATSNNKLGRFNHSLPLAPSSTKMNIQENDPQ